MHIKYYKACAQIMIRELPNLTIIILNNTVKFNGTLFGNK